MGKLNYYIFIKYIIKFIGLLVEINFLVKINFFYDENKEE